MGRASLTVRVVNIDQKPLSGQRVYCEFLRAFMTLLATDATAYTDSDGRAEFQDIPAGEVQVYVRGDMQMSVIVEENDYREVTVTI